MKRSVISKKIVIYILIMEILHKYNTHTVPSAPPDNVQTGMLNLTAGWVSFFLSYSVFIHTQTHANKYTENILNEYILIYICRYDGLRRHHNITMDIFLVIKFRLATVGILAQIDYYYYYYLSFNSHIYTSFFFFGFCIYIDCSYKNQK